MSIKIIFVYVCTGTFKQTNPPKTLARINDRRFQELRKSHCTLLDFSNSLAN